MMHKQPGNVIEELIEALSCLPGVGPKSSQRMAYQLLERNRSGGMKLAEALKQAMELVQHCDECRNFTEHKICDICQQASRQDRQLCVVESPADVLAIEATASYRGKYFVLMGHLSPLDGIGPSQLGLDILAERIRANSYDEIILATNPTIEGEATAHYIFDLCAETNVDVTRIAHGVPLGGELEYVDGSTLAHSFSGRRKFHS